ncbi:MAG: DUF3084 domain-containing protein [Candidatus Wallbacteria bacterium]|nr:DUF3084 domain-containing protein [Candidatus Wallbacteria bacterium]
MPPLSTVGPLFAALAVAVLIALLGGEKGRLIFLILMGGAIAYLGDELGTRFGKKRYSLFGIRPKYTAQVINIVTGLAITLLTLLGMAIISRDFRIALFQVDELQASVEQRRQEVDRLSHQASELTSKVADLDRERQKLSDKNEELNKAIARKSETFIVFPIGKPLLPQPFLFPIDISQEQFTQVMLRMVDEIRRLAKLRQVTLGSEEKQLAHLHEVIPDIYRDIQTLRERFQKRKEAKQIDVMPAEFFVEATSDRNVNIGEELHNINFSIGANVRIFLEGERIASFTVDGTRPRNEVLEQLFLFDQRAMLDMQKRGISPYSLEERSRRFTSELLLQFVSLADQIEQRKAKVEVELTARGDIIRYGKVDVDYKLAAPGAPRGDAPAGPDAPQPAGSSPISTAAGTNPDGVPPAHPGH